MKIGFPIKRYERGQLYAERYVALTGCWARRMHSKFSRRRPLLSVVQRARRPAP